VAVELTVELCIALNVGWLGAVAKARVAGSVAERVGAWHA